MSATRRCFASPAPELDLGFPVTLKLELLQHAGSFKPRGAFNRLLSADLPPAGVIAASGGNHGAAVAYAARALGATAEIFVPTPTPAMKVARIAELWRARGADRRDLCRGAGRVARPPGGDRRAGGACL